MYYCCDEVRKCGLVPDMTATLPKMGVALCSTPQLPAAHTRRIQRQ